VDHLSFKWNYQDRWSNNNNQHYIHNINIV